MKEITTIKDASSAKRAGIATSILGFLGSIASTASMIITNNPVYLYSMGAASIFIAMAGIGLTLYANKKDGTPKKILEFHEANTHKIRIPEKKLNCITSHADFWETVQKLERLDHTDDETFYMTISKSTPDKITVVSWVERSNKAMYTLKDSDGAIRATEGIA